MSRDCRLYDNWAYEYAREQARAAKRPLIVVYNLAPGFLHGGYRQHVFKLAGLKEVARYATKFKTPFYIVGEEGVARFVHEHDAYMVVTDFSPLKESQAWLRKVVHHVKCPVYEVDAHNIIPAWTVSPKLEFAARTLRPKVHRLIETYLEEFPKLSVHPYAHKGRSPDIDWEALRNLPEVERKIASIAGIVPGYKAGMDVLSEFVTHRLAHYGESRNNPNISGQSGLSPYLHYGQIAPARAVLEALETVRRKSETPGAAAARIMDSRKNGSKAGNGSLAAFLEEIVVRRELSDNFCFYNAEYDSVEGFADWAKKTLDAHRTDAREYLYTYAAFESASTHDELWNAAQRELTRTGKMHGYMRMYWGKKILEWTPSPEKAMRIAIRLNNTYELDGRDPNGYTGIAWSLGGVHDRPWFNRPIFGTVRYMARSGCEKKFDVAEYIARFS